MKKKMKQETIILELIRIYFEASSLEACIGRLWWQTKQYILFLGPTPEPVLATLNVRERRSEELKKKLN